MPRIRMLLALAALGLMACGPGGTDSSSAPAVGADDVTDALLEDAASGKSDSAQVVAATLGGSYRLEVRKLPAGAQATTEQLKVLGFTVPAGTAFAVVMRRLDQSAIDCYLALYEGRTKVRTSKYDQAWVPMATESDAVVMRAARARDLDYLVTAGDLELEVDASFQIDIVALDLPVLLGPLADAWERIDLSVTNPTLRFLVSELRGDEPEVVEFMSLGALEEGADGLLVSYPANVPELRDRARLNALVANDNDLRWTLFAEHVNASLDAYDEDLQAQVGAASGVLWRALRSPAHALP